MEIWYARYIGWNFQLIQRHEACYLSTVVIPESGTTSKSPPFLILYLTNKVNPKQYAVTRDLPSLLFCPEGLGNVYHNISCISWGCFCVRSSLLHVVEFVINNFILYTHKVSIYYPLTVSFFAIPYDNFPSNMVDFVYYNNIVLTLWPSA